MHIVDSPKHNRSFMGSPSLGSDIHQAKMEKHTYTHTYRVKYTSNFKCCFATKPFSESDLRRKMQSSHTVKLLFLNPCTEVRGLNVFWSCHSVVLGVVQVSGEHLRNMSVEHAREHVNSHRPSVWPGVEPRDLLNCDVTMSPAFKVLCWSFTQSE